MQKPQQIPYEDYHNAPSSDDKEGPWLYSTQQAESLPVVTLNGHDHLAHDGPELSGASVLSLDNQQPTWKTFFNTPVVKLIIGLVIGIGLLLFVSRFVNIPATIHVLQQNLTTPRSLLLVLLCGVTFLLAFSIRGLRWKLFLNPVAKVSVVKVVQLSLVGIFLNFLLPIRAGEIAKPLMLKRIARVPIGQSVSTVAMDKALDLVPALFIMAIVPFLGLQMDIKLWLVLGLVSGVLSGLIFFVALAAWKRHLAIDLLHKLKVVFPQSIGSKIESFAIGFIDALLLGVSRPKTFIVAILLTAIAVTFDGLFAMLAFWVIGFPIPFATALFGYTVYNMFYILPNPPAQVGSNEAVGLLVFAGLLHLHADKVAAMFVFSHLWQALLMTVTGMTCLSALGLTISSVMKMETKAEGDF